MWTVYIPLWWLQNYHKNHLIENSKSVHLIKECQSVHITFLFVYSTARPVVTLRNKKNNVKSVHSPLVITKTQPQNNSAGKIILRGSIIYIYYSHVSGPNSTQNYSAQNNSAQNYSAWNWDPKHDCNIYR